jgi:uncharacterized alpha-E superfamily protein
MIAVYTNLLLDMPRGVDIGWYHLVTLNDAEDWFEARYKVKDERNVMKFLLSDTDYPGSMLSSLRWVRENMRTTRDEVPAESWEYANEMSLFVQENLQRGINRGTRHEFLADVIKNCQQLLGLFEGTMSENHAKIFQRLGRNLERADMTTRILDAGIGILVENKEHLLPTTEQIVWANVLQSSSAYLPYVRFQRASVKGPRVVRFMLEHPEFPRTIAYCIGAIREDCEKLPRSDRVVRQADRILKSRYTSLDDEEGIPHSELSDYLNELQLRIAGLHQLFAETWFDLS